MMSGLILITLMALIALVLLMGYRMITLVHSEPLSLSSAGVNSARQPVRSPNRKASVLSRGKAKASQRVTSNDRTELLTHLHILAGLQERDCRVSGLEVVGGTEAVQAFATAWLYGAACALCEPSRRHSEALDAMVAHIASRKTGGRQSLAMQTIGSLTTSSILLACFRSGLEGAEFWQEHQYVPPRHSLYGAITNNAFI